MNKNELITHISHSWDALEAALERLSDEQMTVPQDAAGWTVKDHLVHLKAWERSVVFFLQGQPRHGALGIDEAIYGRVPIDEMNAAIYQHTKNLSLDEALTQFQEVHRQLIDLLQPLTDADLQKPYHAYLPDEPGEGEARLALDVIYNNTANHFAEHQAWIEALAA